MSIRFRLPILLATTIGLLLGSAFAQVELRMTWYDDGSEGVVLRELLDRL